MYNQNTQTEKWADDDQLVFVPNELYRSFCNTFNMMEKAWRELNEMAKEMKLIEN